MLPRDEQLLSALKTAASALTDAEAGVTAATTGMPSP